jgi:alginate O-acetyltransferase complex protein AlgJ
MDRHENRAKTSFPSFDSTLSENYFPQVDKYLADNFVLKYAYIGGINSFRKRLFNFADPGLHVIAGKDGWLFYNSCRFDDGGMDEYSGLLPWSREMLQNAVSNLKNMSKWCEQHHVIFIPLICPNKQSIYPEMLPAVYKKYGKNCFDQLCDAAPSLINLREVLLRQKNQINSPLYYKTDSHWSELGAFLAVSEVSRILNKENAQVPVLGPSDISITQTNVLTRTDLLDMLVLNGQEQEKEVKIHFNNPNTHKLHKVFVIHDSFYSAMIPSLHQLFDSIQERHSFSGLPGAKEVLDARPDVFIFEVVERSEEQLSALQDEGFFK